MVSTHATPLGLKACKARGVARARRPLGSAAFGGVSHLKQRAFVELECPDDLDAFSLRPGIAALAADQPSGARCGSLSSRGAGGFFGGAVEHPGGSQVAVPQRRHLRRGSMRREPGCVAFP